MSLRKVGRAILLAVGGAAGLGLLSDATTYALLPPDPATGRERGCFTLVDLALGLARPSELSRMVELVLGGALLILPFVALQICRRQHRRVLESRSGSGV
jgi:hypothetical protein